MARPSLSAASDNFAPLHAAIRSAARQRPRNAGRLGYINHAVQRKGHDRRPLGRGCSRCLSSGVVRAVSSVTPGGKGRSARQRAAPFFLFGCMRVRGAESISSECEGAHTSLAIFPSKVRSELWCQEADMAHDSLAFRFAVVLALAVVILVIMTLAAPPPPANGTAAPIQSSDPIYRAQYLNLY